MTLMPPTLMSFPTCSGISRDFTRRRCPLVGGHDNCGKAIKHKNNF